MLAKDKQKHFVAGLVLALVAGIFLWPIIPVLNWKWFRILVLLGCPGFGFSVAALAGALKEIIWDWLLKKGTPEFLDFLATAAGGALGAILLITLG